MQDQLTDALVMVHKRMFGYSGVEYSVQWRKRPGYLIT
jgi:hypothetical protein